jgi:hypothetical protein
VVQVPHLKAAVAIWTYSERSAQLLFNERTGHRLADYLLLVLRAHPDGLTRTDLSDVLGRNRRADEIHEVLQLLRDYGLAVVVREPVAQLGGRPVHRWVAVDPGSS